MVDRISRIMAAEMAHAVVRAHHPLAVLLMPPRATHPWSSHQLPPP
jgi:hypothetical protein